MPSASRATSHARRTRQGRAGFTLFELMVAMVAGSLVIGSLYYIGAGSSQVFQQQERVSQLQVSLQLAMNQIRRDVSRAGLFASANSLRARPSFCPPSGNILALQHLDNADQNLVDPTGGHGVEADQLTLIGNTLTSDEYFAASAVGGTIRLQRNHQNFARSFETWWDGSTPGTIDADRVRDVFRANRLLRIRRNDGDGYEFYVRLADSGGGSGVVSIPPASPINTPLQLAYVAAGGNVPMADSPCMPDTCLGCRVAPLAQIHYQVVPATGETVAVSDLAAGPVTHLIRRELDPSAGAGVTLQGIPDRIVLENVVEFDVAFMVAVNGNNQNIQRLDTIGPLEIINVRSVIVTISARTPEQDPRFPWQPRGGGPLTRFRFDAARPGAARVRSLRAEIPVENFILQRRP